MTQGLSLMIGSDVQAMTVAQKLQEYTVPWLISRHGIQAKTVTKIDPEVILKMISYHVKQNNLCWLASTLDALKDQ